ncbi:MAG: pyridoxal-dependent decarboxylase [Thermoanaerobacterales bacterium]|mgnify:CR=1 FL=1|jgi:aromatic-L-amino-acid decarboxylase|nr:aspartate aminotransferase family protein [Thermoanaerobacterales bacterium]
MADRPPYHMTPDEFRRWGRAVVDWVADYWATVERHRVVPEVEPGEVRSWLPPAPPEAPEPFEEVLADLDRVVLPGTTHWQHPGFHAYFPANTSGPGVLADIVSGGLATQGMLWQTGPALTEVEAHVLDWLVDLLGLPERFRSTGAGGGVIQDSASSATLCALVAARERALARGAALDRLVVYSSEHAHSSLEKGARVAGLRPENVRLLDVDDTFALRPDALEAAIEADTAAGLVPCLVMATIGTTSSLAVDPLPAVGPIAARAGAWFHVDGAMAGSAAVCPEHRDQQAGLEHADSYVFNPHKWLFTTFDCSCLFVADRAPLVEALSILPEYLRNAASESGRVVDYRDWQIPLGRRFRALKLWFVLRWYGAEGLRHHVREHVRLAGELAGRIERDPRLELAAPARLNLVCFRHVDGDEATQRLHEALNATGRVYLTHTRLAGRYVVRAAIGAWTTEQRHVDALWELIDELA